LSNSVKFTRAGNIHLTLKTTATPNKPNFFCVEISVKDTGIGIAEEKLEAIFESFNQADNSTTRKYGGTGLGLSISKNLAELMGGTLSLQSQKNKGSCFMLSIQLQEADISAIPTTTEKLKINPNLKSANILIVEDNKINMLVILTYLKNKLPNAQLSEVQNGQEAVNIFKQNRFDLIFMDIQLPILNGYDATRQIRQYEAQHYFNAIPIIGLTAGAMLSDKENCLASGMNSYLSKPFSPKEIDDILNMYL
jgi:CheY-like chemotaxis protein